MLAKYFCHHWIIYDKQKRCQLEEACEQTRTWLGVWPGVGHASITVETRLVSAWTRECLPADSGRVSARCKAPFNSHTSVACASGLKKKTQRQCTAFETSSFHVGSKTQTNPPNLTSKH